MLFGDIRTELLLHMATERKVVHILTGYVTDQDIRIQGY